jgi:hypothetical protein
LAFDWAFSLAVLATSAIPKSIGTARLRFISCSLPGDHLADDALCNRSTLDEDSSTIPQGNFAATVKTTSQGSESALNPDKFE